MDPREWYGSCENLKGEAQQFFDEEVDKYLVYDAHSNKLVPEKQEATRYNEGKPRIGLIPPVATLEIAKVFTMGAEKYGEHNWEKGQPEEQVLSSCLRHINAYQRRETNDPESGLHHLAHAVANLMMQLHYDLEEY